MSFNLLGKIASAHIDELRKLAAPAPRPASKPMAAPTPAKPKPTHHVYDNKGMPLRKPNDPRRAQQQTQEEWVPHWPKGRDIGTGP